MNQLNDLEIQAIKDEAESFATKPFFANGGKYSVCPIMYMKKGYIAALTSERQKVKGLLDEIKDLLESYRGKSNTTNNPVLEAVQKIDVTINKIITNYNNKH